MTTRLILMVDDDPAILYLAKVGLKRMTGWRVITATSGEEGLAIAIAEQPDAILLDMMMPGMDGLTTLKQLQANPKIDHIPVIFLTAKTQTSDKLHFSGQGAAGLIPKPFDPNTLAAEVKALLGEKIG